MGEEGGAAEGAEPAAGVAQEGTVLVRSVALKASLLCQQEPLKHSFTQSLIHIHAHFPSVSF